MDLVLFHSDTDTSLLSMEYYVAQYMGDTGYVTGKNFQYSIIKLGISILTYPLPHLTWSVMTIVMH